MSPRRALPLLLWTLALAARAETVSQTAQLTRAQLETAGANLALTAADSATTTVRTLTLELRFDEPPLTAAGGNAWSYSVSYRITDGTSPGAARSLTLFRGTDRDVFRAADRIDGLVSPNARIDIDGTTTTDAAAVPANLRLVARLDSTRFTGFARNTAPVLTVSSGAAPLLQWTTVAGAEEYEIESVYFDAREPASSGDPFAARAPVRFQTRDLSLPVDLYRSAGTAYYRVRAVGRQPADPRVRRPGAWSATRTVALSGTGFEANKNWQYERRYAADGPVHGSLNYFDGNLRMRQVQSGAPDHISRRIAETKYDHEGRPGVNFLATPQPGAQFDYVPGFNRAADGTPYGPDHFDWSAVSPASNSSGAGRYFSSANTATDATTPYVPDAGGYPFSVAEHKRDDSARLRAMSGFGAPLRLGGGHDSVYVYGDAAESQLRPLFGANLGNARNFERTVTGDPNRSFEVLYRDSADHVVAQAQIGDPPPNLSDLENAPQPALTSVSMDANNQVDPVAGNSKLNYRIANAVSTSYFFAYSPTGVDYSADPADARFPPLCATCRYRLRIRVLDPSGAPVALAQSSTPQNDPNCAGVSTSSNTTLIEQVIQNPNPPSCPVNGSDFTRGYTVPPVRFCARLTEPGEYEVQKSLEFIDGEIDASIAELTRTPGFFTAEEFRETPDPASCGDSCLNHCAAATGVDPATAPNDPQLLSCVQRCEHPESWVLDIVDANKCDTLERTLSQDMAPGGAHYRASGNNALSNHPEFCHLGVCRQMSASDRFDTEMGLVDSYDEALCAGYLNPTGITSGAAGPPAIPASCTVAVRRDPFFAAAGPGQSRRSEINAMLGNFTATIAEWADPASLSLWQFVADARINSVGGSSGPTPDEQWRLFRGLYLGAKKRLVVDQTENPSGLSCPFSTASNARVPKPRLPATTVEVIDAIDSVTAQQCGNICAGRVDGWMRQLQGSCPNPVDAAGARRALNAYCASSCGANNPLASLLEDDLAAGDPNLTAALAALGPGCSLDDVAVKDPYVYQTVCGETCCSDLAPTNCAENLMTTLGERLPPTAVEVTVRDTPTGEKLRSCLDWVDHLRFDPVAQLLDKPGQQACTIAFVAPDGRRVPVSRTKILGAPRVQSQPPPNPAGVAGLVYTGLVVDVEAGSTRLSVAIYSDCQIEWTRDLGKPVCETNIVSTPPPGCKAPKSNRVWSSRAYVPRGAACPVGDVTPPKPADLRSGRRYSGGPQRSPPPAPPRDSCPNCLDDLAVLLDGHKPSDLAHLEAKERNCFIKLVPEGNKLIATQPGGGRCDVYLLDRAGTPTQISRIVLFEEVVRGVPLPGGITGPPGSRYMGAAVRVRTANGATELLYVFSDCNVISPEICGTECTPISRPPVCISGILAELMRVQAAGPKKRLPKPPKGTKAPKELPRCFQNLRAGKNEATYDLPDNRKCQLVLFDAAGRAKPLDALRGGALRWVGTVPARPTHGRLRFTGYVVITSKGVELSVYSSCDDPPRTGCEVIVVDVNVSIPPPTGTPEGVCTLAVNEAADDRARLEVERARDEFSEFYKSVHFNRCFGDQLHETFSFQSRSREYQYTLRYYDQAGNLVQTVPPEGVAPSAAGTPAHTLLSRYKYNSLEQVVSQDTPDTGERRFYFDRAARVRFSQDAQQRIDGAFAYVKYDALGRTVEAGRLRGLGEAVIRARIDEAAFPSAADGALEQVTTTVHDTAAVVPVCAPLAPRNLRGRVAAVIAATTLGVSTVCYSYDIDGRTNAVLRDTPGLGTKRIDYEYDALTGRVAAIYYQRGQPDALLRRQLFNRRNSLVAVESSRDGVMWERDASYDYYAHGPLARAEIGADAVQGIDYTYTIDGRPKGINTGTLTPERDPGHDGLAAGTRAAVARDAAGQSLEFFAGDYTPIGASTGALSAAAIPHSSAVSGTTASTFGLASCEPATVSDGCGLYEGSLARSVLGLAGLDGFARVTGFAYRYDRLYRLTQSTSHDGLDPLTNRWPTGTDNSLWRSSFGFDGNGNITRVARSALASVTPTPSSAAMDQLEFHYARNAGRLTSNRLQHIHDSVAANIFPADLDDQGVYAASNAATHNYAYDANGNLTRDRAAGITAVTWDMSNRLVEMERGAERIEFLYDGLGNRFAKIHKPSSDPASWDIEFFVRDENGTLLATYRTPPGASPALEDLFLRGVGELGVIRADHAMPASVAAGTYAVVRGDKQYQLSNYLGHVLATVSDRRQPVVGGNGAIIGYTPVILSATDYDVFGAPPPGRFVESDPYLFGFSGFERDDDLKGPGNSYYTRDRLFDPRIGRWLSADPIQLAHGSPYVGFSNNPVRYGDPRGQLDWDSFKDTMENVAITARDIQRDTTYILSGQAIVDGVADNLVKAKASYDKGQTSEAIAHAIGIQDAIESLAQKDLDWQEGGATTEDRIRMGIGEVSGMNDVARAITGETEFAEELTPEERLQLGIQGGVKVITIAAQGASIATSMMPKQPGGAAAPKPSAKAPMEPSCPLSFAPGTAVWTGAGVLPIESLSSGGLVFTVDPESGFADYFPVLAFTTSTHLDGLDLLLETEDGRRETITTTSEHPFWRLGDGWIAAGELAPDDVIESQAGTLRIVEIAPVDREFSAHNLTVGGAHTYLVGDLGVWVHNCLGGKHGKVKAKGFESHHIPPNSVSPLSTNRGPAIRMKVADHRKTRSWGSSNKAKEYRAEQKRLIKQGKFRQAQNRDIRDIREKFGKKYDKGIKQAREYTKTIPKKDLK